MTRRLSYTPCYIETPDRQCLEPAHVVLFALGGEFAGRTYHPGEKVLACLTHGAHILDARRQRTTGGVGRVADWLRLDMDRLPLPKLPTHAEPTPAARPYPRADPRAARKRLVPGPAEARPARRGRNWRETGDR